MCGRFAIATLPQFLAERPWIARTPPGGELPAGALSARYNLAPQQDAAVVLNGETPALDVLRWGLVPSWARDPAVGNKLINARAETLAEKPSFRDALRRRRCLVPADGFYEWQKDAAADGGKRPHFLRVEGGRPFAFAGLWESWRDPEGGELRTFTIVTCEPNETVKPLHHRMACVLDKTDERAWLDPRPLSEQDAADLASRVLRPYDAHPMEAYPVSRLVNSPANEGPEVSVRVEPEAAAGEQRTLFG